MLRKYDRWSAGVFRRGGRLLSSAIPADSLRVNCIRKVYPDGSSRVMVSDRAIWTRPGYEPVGDLAAAKRRRGRLLAEYVDFDPDDETAYEIAERGGKQDEQRRRAALDRAKRRAKSAVRDLAYSNDFRYFVTLTLDQTKINRYDIREITRRLNYWLDNHVRRHGLKYVLVAEHHKDGAVHFHGFFNDALEAVDSGHVDKKRHRVYNLPAWDFGFTTAIKLYGDRHKAVGYVCKYITKAEEKVGGRWYYSGGGLRRPAVDYLSVDFDQFSDLEGAYFFEIGDTGAKCVMFDVKGGEDEAAGRSVDLWDRSEPEGGDGLSGIRAPLRGGAPGGAGEAVRGPDSARDGTGAGDVLSGLEQQHAGRDSTSDRSGPGGAGLFQNISKKADCSNDGCGSRGLLE